MREKNVTAGAAKISVLRKASPQLSARGVSELCGGEASSVKESTVATIVGKCNITEAQFQIKQVCLQKHMKHKYKSHIHCSADEKESQRSNISVYVKKMCKKNPDSMMHLDSQVKVFEFMICV